MKSQYSNGTSVKEKTKFEKRVIVHNKVKNSQEKSKQEQLDLENMRFANRLFEYFRPRFEKQQKVNKMD